MMNYVVEIIGIYGLVTGLIAMMEDGILKFWGDFIQKLPKDLAKPLGKCEMCFGTWVYIAYQASNYFFDYPIFDYIVKIGLLYFLIKLFEIKNEKVKRRSPKDLV